MISVINVAKFIELRGVRVLAFEALRLPELNLFVDKLFDFLVVLCFDASDLKLMFLLVSLVLEARYFRKLSVQQVLRVLNPDRFAEVLLMPSEQIRAAAKHSKWRYAVSPKARRALAADIRNKLALSSVSLSAIESRLDHLFIAPKRLSLTQRWIRLALNLITIR